MLKLKISGILMQIDGAKQRELKDFLSFKTDSHGYPDLKVNLTRQRNITLPEDMLLLDDEIKWYRSEDEGLFFAVFMNAVSQGISARLGGNEDWTQVSACYQKAAANIERSNIKRLLEVSFRNRLIGRQGFVIHAAALDWQGQGIIFTAPSGTGKTTQARLWEKMMNARIINGDRPALMMQSGCPVVSGTPWSGSTNDFIDTTVPLSAIIVLEQAQENSIALLDNASAASKILPRCFLPYFSVGLMEKAISNIEAVISSTRVYLLRCRPDEEAVEMVHQCLK